jgi:hypothetical protein
VTPAAQRRAASPARAHTLRIALAHRVLRRAARHSGIRGPGAARFAPRCMLGLTGVGAGRDGMPGLQGLPGAPGQEGPPGVPGTPPTPAPAPLRTRRASRAAVIPAGARSDAPGSATEFRCPLTRRVDVPCRRPGC